MEEEGVALRDIWQWFMRKRIPATIIFGITTILVFVVIMFGYNRMVVKYEAKFHYSWYGIENRAYANGMLFNYYDIIDEDNLQKVKDSASEFREVDVDALKNNISIMQKEQEYLLTIDGNFFSDDSQARRFVLELIRIPYQTGLELGFDFTSNMKGFHQAIRINDKLDYLSAQLNFMLTNYRNMISYFGNLDLNGVRLNERLEELEVFSSNQPINEFKHWVYKHSYMSEEEYQLSLSRLSSLETELSLLNKRKELLLSSIQDIYNTTANTAYIDTALQNYLDSLHQIDTRIMAVEETKLYTQNALNGNYDKEASNAFMEELEAYAVELENFTKQFTESVEKTIQQSTIMNVSYFKVLNKLSKSISVIISLVVGMIVGFISGMILGYIDEKRESEVPLG